MSRPTTLYRFFDAADVLLYVGITTARDTRWQQHASGKEWWSEVASATVEHFDSHREAEVAEAVAIQDEEPRHNVQRPKPSFRPVPVRPHRSAVGPGLDACDPVGSKDIAERTGMQANTVHVWMKRGLLPKPRWVVSGAPAWDWRADIVPWLLAHPRRAHLAGVEQSAEMLRLSS